MAGAQASIECWWLPGELVHVGGSGTGLGMGLGHADGWDTVKPVRADGRQQVARRGVLACGAVGGQRLGDR